MRSMLRRVAIVLALALSVGVLDAPPAQAVPARTTCFSDYGGCVNTAANLPDFWTRGLAGLDCAVDLAVCLKAAWN